MKLEFHEKGKPVFHYKDTAEKFYIILKGKVNVWVPKPYKKVKFEGKQFIKIETKKLKDEKKERLKQRYFLL